MHLPIDFTRTIEVGAEENLRERTWQDRFLGEAAEQIKKRKAMDVRIQGDRLEFLGPSLFTSQYNLLAPITSGWIEIHAQEPDVTIEYRLSFSRGIFWFALAAGGLIALVFRANGLPATSTLLCVAFAWSCVFLNNVVLTLWRFDGLMRTVLEEVQP